MTAGRWVPVGYGMPCGAREISVPEDDRVWLDVCVLGQHLPQMYRLREVRPLDRDGCAALGLCPDCLGAGDPAAQVIPPSFAALTGNDTEAHVPCPGCGGSGRPAVRVTVTRGDAGTFASLRPLPHQYVPPGEQDPLLLAAFSVPPGLCLACGMPRDGTGPRKEMLHL